MPRKLSDNGLRFIAAWETFQPRPYFATQKEAQRRLFTWGFGHTGTNPPDSITRDQAMALLRADVADAEGWVNKYAHPSINQAQFDALVDLVINAGNGPIMPDNIKGDFDDAVRNGDWAAVRATLPLFRKQGGEVLKGLVRRANGRLALFDGNQWGVAERIGRTSA